MERRPNGGDVETLFATIDAVRQRPEVARLRFRAVNGWVSGAHSRGRFPGFFAAGQELRGVTCRVEGDIDLRGILAIDPQVRNGSSDIRVVFDVEVAGR